MNKAEYDKQYIKDNRKSYGWNLSIQEYEAFAILCNELHVNRSEYLKTLVNADVQKRGFPLVFREKDQRQ